MLPLSLAFLSAASTFLGGITLLLFRPSPASNRYLLSFASGVMLSVAFLEMLPQVGHSEETVFLALALGFLSLYLIEKLMLIHSCPEGECEFHTIGMISIIGIALESLLDGIAIGAGFILSFAIGIFISLAVIVHEFPRGITTSAIMLGSGYSRKVALGALSIDALFAPLGTALVLLRLFPQKIFVPLLAFTAGTFIYIGASDLLPEAHRRFNLKVVFCLLSGFLLIPLLGMLFKGI